MAECKRCGKSFHACGSCCLDYNWQYEYCSEECWRATDIYIGKKLAFIMFFKSLEHEQRITFLMLLSSISGNRDYSFSDYNSKFATGAKGLVESARGEIWEWVKEAREQIETNKREKRRRRFLELKKEFGEENS